MTVLDRAAIDRLVADLGGEGATVAEIIGMFLMEAPVNLKELREATGRKDVEVARRAAHNLKSTSLQFGATALSSRCKDIETAARAGTLPTLAGLDEVDALWAPVREALAQEQARLAG